MRRRPSCRRAQARPAAQHARGQHSSASRSTSPAAEEGAAPPRRHPRPAGGPRRAPPAAPEVRRGPRRPGPRGQRQVDSRPEAAVGPGPAGVGHQGPRGGALAEEPEAGRERSRCRAPPAAGRARRRPGSRAVRRGSSASTVPAPTSTASTRSRSRCDPRARLGAGHPPRVAGRGGDPPSRVAATSRSRRGARCG